MNRKAFLLWIKNHKRISAVAGALFLLGIIIFLYKGGNDSVEDISPALRSVEKISVRDYAPGGATGYVVQGENGTFVIRSESGGKVKKSLSTGTKITKGTVIVELENSAQRAALIQAEGQYDAAVAGKISASYSGTSAGTSLEAAQDGAKTAVRSAYTFLDDAVRTKTDAGFTDPSSDEWRRFIADDIDYAMFSRINDGRRDFVPILKNMQTLEQKLSNTNNLQSSIDEAKRDIAALSLYLDNLSVAWNKTRSNDTTRTEAVISTQKATIAALRSGIVSVQSSLTAAEAGLAQAKTGSARTAQEIGTSGTASAQVKIAYGVLEAARSAYEKTIIRAPFDGVLTRVQVKEGDIVSMGVDIAVIAPNTLDETVPVFTLPLTAVKYTPSGSFVFGLNEKNAIVAIPVTAGLITVDAVSVKGLTGSEIIVKDVRGLKDGDTVTINDGTSE